MKRRNEPIATDCNKDRGISLDAHAGKVFLKIVASRLWQTTAARSEGLLPEEQLVRLPPRTIDDRYVVRLAPVTRARTTE